MHGIVKGLVILNAIFSKGEKTKRALLSTIEKKGKSL